VIDGDVLRDGRPPLAPIELQREPITRVQVVRLRTERLPRASAASHSAHAPLNIRARYGG
jgi:hypothetical protein